MHRFMVSYVEQIMTGLVRKGFYWSYDAADFLDMLYSGQLPPMIVKDHSIPYEHHRLTSQSIPSSTSQSLLLACRVLFAQLRAKHW